MTASQIRRIVAATLVALIALAGLTSLGFWQYARAHRDDISRRVAAEQPAQLMHVLAPGDYMPDSLFTRAVIVKGTLQASSAVASCERSQSDGTQGCWLIAPVDLDATHAVTMVLGFVANDQTNAALAHLRARGATDVELVGRLQPDEMVGVVGGAVMHPTDKVPYVDAHTLTMLWRTSLIDGYVVAEQPYAGAAITDPLLTPPSGITWRNLLYAWQWWAFALFVAFLLARYIIDVRNESRTLVPQSQEEQS